MTRFLNAMARITIFPPVRMYAAIAVLFLCAFQSSAQNVITTAAGAGRTFSDEGGRALGAQTGGLVGVAGDKAGNLYTSDDINHLVYKITPSGVITVVAGNNIAGFSGDGGPATNASLNLPFGLALDAAGNLYIADSQNLRIRMVTPGASFRP